MKNNFDFQQWLKRNLDVDYTTNSPSYYHDLARKQSLIELLAKKIWEYEEKLNITLKELEERLTEYINENDELIAGYVEDWNNRIEELPTVVESMMSDWLSDGTLDHIINETIFSWKVDKIDFDEFKESNTSQLAHIEINLQDFGELGGGVASDTLTFIEAVNYAYDNDFILKIPNLINGLTVRSSEVVPLPMMKSDGGEIIIEGGLRFDVDKNVKLVDVDFTLVEGYGVHDTFHGLGFINPKQEDTVIDRVEIDNVCIRGVVNEKERVRGIRLPVSKQSKIENVFSENVGTAIFLMDGSENIYINNVHGRNIETNVWLRNFENAHVLNASIINTKEQATWWVGQELGVGVNGKDVLLTVGGEHLTIDNIYGEFCIERPVYCQSSYVNADNLESVNCGGSKFVGSQTDPNVKKKNVFVGTMIIRVDDRRIPDTISQVYGMENIYFDTIKLFFKENGENTSLTPFTIGGNNDNVTINKIESYGYNQSLFRKQLGITDKVIINSIEINAGVGSKIFDGLVMTKDTQRYNDSHIIDYLEIGSIKVNLRENKTRWLFYFTDTNRLYKKIKIDNIIANGFGTTVDNVYGFPNLNNVDLMDTTITNSLSINIYEDKPFTGEIHNMVLNNKTGTEQTTMTIDTLTKKSGNILDFVQVFEVNKQYSETETNITSPFKTNQNIKIKINSEKGGYGEFIYSNGFIEIVATDDVIAINDSTTPPFDKVSVYVTSGGNISVRGRFPNDVISVRMSKL